MDQTTQIIEKLFDAFSEVRYVAIYKDQRLSMKQKGHTSNNSSQETDKYEELLVNPIILTSARQRGNIDCGGLEYVLVSYGNFFQLIKELKGGHISICIEKNADLKNLPDQIFILFQSISEGLFTI